MTINKIWVWAILLVISGCIGTKQVNIFQGEQSSQEIQVVQSPEITLRVGDILFVDFVPNMQQNTARTSVGGAGVNFEKQFSVRKDGTVFLPEIGTVPVLGLNLDQAQAIIADSIRNNYRDFTLRVELASFEIMVLGEVARQGIVKFSKRQVTVIEAIAAAGGFSPDADKARIQLIRNLDGKMTVHEFSVLDRSVFGTENYFLQPNDLITIPKMKQTFWRAQSQPFVNSIQLTISLLSSVLVIWSLLK